MRAALATQKAVHPGHGAFHPVAWCHYYSGGRAWITSLGTDASATSDLTIPPTGSTVPNRAAFQSIACQRHQIGDGIDTVLHVTVKRTMPSGIIARFYKVFGVFR